MVLRCVNHSDREAVVVYGGHSFCASCYVYSLRSQNFAVPAGWEKEGRVQGSGPVIVGGSGLKK